MPSYSIGLDLGQAQDYSALAVVERVHVLPAEVSLLDYRQRGDVAAREAGGFTEELHVRFLKRWPLGTSYTAVVDDVLQLKATPALEWSALAVDRSGVGRAVVDLFRQARVKGRLRGHLLPLTITSGVERGDWSIPKNDLIDGLLVPVTQGRVRVAEGLALGETLRTELLAFTQSQTAAGRLKYDFERREGQGHGDLAMALMLALAPPRWRGAPEVVENTDTIGAAR